MDDSKNSPPKGEFNWQNFKKVWGNDFPFNIHEKMDDLSWVDKYVQDAMTQFLPKPVSIKSQTKKNLQMEIFETHKNVIVKLHFSEEEVRNITVFAGINRIKLEGLPGNTRKIIKLTTYVIPESCSAVFRNGILQLHMRKQALDDYFQEIDIKFPK
ncbi:Hsp20/alpha crystallin family protein [Paenibacillus sp. sptzw28]|uniref:Hsp20/alpha crystallin family protein n=1 Tax=Paenibacillus sp. sptzw28 TaxID=715179 RepID=UPI001C6EC719|nr:Hsp20/alpha crystallin family protein [Paenibacillus sp. sptzw28]QYR22589.1 Hsp20/alpha crystallin family protein [Paenibacillus sp. sptzw28]